MHLLKYNGLTSAGMEMASVHAEAAALTADETSAGVRQPQERRKPGDLLYKDTNGGIMNSHHRTINPERVLMTKRLYIKLLNMRLLGINIS